MGQVIKFITIEDTKQILSYAGIDMFYSRERGSPIFWELHDHHSQEMIGRYEQKSLLVLRFVMNIICNWHKSKGVRETKKAFTDNIVKLLIP